LPKTNNCISKVCPKIVGIGLLRPWNILKEKREKLKTLYSYFVNYRPEPTQPHSFYLFFSVNSIFVRLKKGKDDF
jgi:hypothetical protein